MPEIASVAAGIEHGLALDSAGRVWSFGRNSFGQLGDGTRVSRPTDPRIVEGLPRIIAIAAGAHTSLALDDSLRVWTWCQTGLAGDTGQRTPVLVPGLPDVRAISVRSREDAFVSVVLATDGTVWTWGGETNAFPQRVALLTDVVAISAGGGHDLALTLDGSVWVWGSNASGAFGNGARTNSSVPVRVPGLEDVVAISAGDDVSYAVTESGAVLIFGDVSRLTGMWSGANTRPVLAPRAFVAEHFPLRDTTAGKK